MADLARPGRVNPGRLDRRITIQRMGPAFDDGMREKEGGWFDVSTRFAGFEPLSGAEKVVAAENAAFQMRKFRIRRPRAFTLDPNKHRLIYRNLPHDIVDVQEIGREWVDVLATVRADAAEPAT